jgi:HSP20 family protein
MTNLIVRREPFNLLLDDFFNDFFGRTAPVSREGQETAVRARMDVIDQGDRYEVLVDLPGVKKDDIQVAIEGTRVSISAETKFDREQKEGERLLHRERFAASYARNFELPVEVSEDGAQAAFENGVLRLNLPKRAAVAGKRLQIH